MKRRIINLRLVLSSMILLFLAVTQMNAQEAFGSTLPSDAYLQQSSAELNSASGDNGGYSVSNVTPFSTSTRGIRSVGNWDDPFFPGENGEDSNGGNVGRPTPAPLGDVTPIILISFIAMYFVFRCVSATKRKNF